MHPKCATALSMLILLSTFLPTLRVFSMSLTDRWQALMDDGPNQQAKGRYDNAIRAFSLAASLAEKQKLPPKCLPLALCRLTQVEVLSNHYDLAESHFQQLTKLVKAQKQEGRLDPEVGVWLVDLADTYQARQNPKVRESCLRNACMLKSLTFGGEHKECTDCLMLLAHLYLDRGQSDKAVQILSTIAAMQEKKYGKNPDAIGNIMHQLALDYEQKRQYGQAKQLELAVIRLAKATSSPLNSGLPAFYAFLGMNALARGKTNEARQYYLQSTAAAKNIKADTSRQAAQLYLDPLIDSTNADLKAHHFLQAETELKRLLEVQEAISSDYRKRYGCLSLLSVALDCEHKYKESDNYLLQTISIAELPGSFMRKDIPELYMRMALFEDARGDVEQSNDHFKVALAKEPDKSSFHATLVLLHWGCRLIKHKDFARAEEKLDLALANARHLAPEKRGTLLADSASLVSYLKARSGKDTESQALGQEILAEIAAQKKINSKLGPDFLHRL